MSLRLALALPLLVLNVFVLRQLLLPLWRRSRP